MSRVKGVVRGWILWPCRDVKHDYRKPCPLGWTWECPGHENLTCFEWNWTWHVYAVLKVLLNATSVATVEIKLK